MASVKYKCPLCERSAIIKTICPICTRQMVEVCARCERSVNNCICSELPPVTTKTEIPYERQKTVYRCFNCRDESTAPTECAYCDGAMVEVIVCSICGKTAEECLCDEEGIEGEAEESEGEGEEIEMVEEGSEDASDEK